MNDEIRRLIYELVVEAKGVKEAEDKINLSAKAMESLQAAAKKAGAALAGAFAVREIGQMLGNIQKVQSQLKGLGLSSSEAAQGMKDIENTAVTTGSTIDEVTQVYTAAIEATQKLGGTQKDAAELAEAFTRAAKAEGKSAADAAKQLDTLQFAMDRGTVKAKELANIMKENETFQQAAEKAMGKTTAQIIAMANAGKLGAEDLAKMLEVMKEMGANKEVPTTLEGITNSLISMGAAFVDATAGAAGLNDSLSKGNSGAWMQFLNILRLIGTVIGTIISLAFNLIETLAQAAIAINVAFVRAITGDFKGAVEAFDLFSQQVKENVNDVAASIKKIGEAWDQATGNMPAQPPGRQLGDPKTLAQQAKDATIEGAVDDFFKDWDKLVEKARQDRIKKAEKEAKDLAEINQRRVQQEAEDAVAAREFQAGIFAQVDQDIADTTVEIGERTNESLEAQMQERSDTYQKMLDEIREKTEAGAAVIGNALSQAFDGGIANAREFFTEILKGFAQLAASAAIQKMLKALSKEGGFFETFMTTILSERGNVFAQGQLVPFAAGGVVSSPTAFPLAGGRMGIMGEAGAEAVMPLRRGADGKLGVQGLQPRVEIHNNLGVEATARVDASQERTRIVLEAAQAGANMAEARVNRSLRSGYGSTAQSMQRTYGLRRRF